MDEVNYKFNCCDSDHIFHQDSEVFEITDFTCASEWERFINDFEEVIRQWELASKKSKSSPRKLKINELSEGQWVENSEKLKFCKANFVVSHLYLKLPDLENNDRCSDLPVSFEDAMASLNDFPLRAHCIARWYGLREFIVISPTVQTEPVYSEDKLKLLLSSAAIAVNNMNCEIPVYVQLNQKHRRLFHGICSGPEFTCQYDMIHFSRPPAKYSYLSELLNLFKAKLGYSTLECPAISVAIRFTHILKDWPADWQLQEHPIDTECPPAEVTQTVASVSHEEPSKEYHLCATWPPMSEELVSDSPFYSDLDSLHAPKWTVRVRIEDSSSQLLYEDITPAGKRNMSLLDQLPTLGAPVVKEFILRTMATRPAVYSRPAAQRMYCYISASEFRIAGSFAEDSTYF
ncbi:Rab3 GTPase-activating protein catalytic subunit [Halotydeus destructor]|nr:Rab3 GTPase-activating protein catalytic subunit [Halotydeus destructor]